MLFFTMLSVTFSECSSIQDDDMFIVVQKNEKGEVDPRAFGKIEIKDGKAYVWKPNQIVLFRCDATFAEQVGKTGAAYRLDDNLNLIRIGTFDVEKSNIELQNELKIYPGEDSKLGKK